MKLILLILTVVMGQSVLAADRNLIADPNVRKKVRASLENEYKPKKFKDELSKADLAKVKSLHLETNPVSQKITDESLAGLAHLSQLKFLYLSNTQITNMALHKVAECKLLKVLALNNTQIDNRCIDQLIKLRKLTILKLERTEVTKTGVAKLKKALPKCTIRSDHD